MKVTLIRHTSVDVQPGTCYGWTDVPLKKSFPEEAALSCQQLNGKQFDASFTSPLSRCTRLAEFCGFPEAIRENRLKELHAGEWEMQLFEEIKDPRIQEWYKDFLHYQIPGGESFMMLYQRVSSFLDELKEKSYRHVIIFAHGGVLLAAQMYTKEITIDEKAIQNLTPHGGIIEITI